MKNAENPILTISLLASDRLDTIPRCLDSLKEIREAIPSELIIVDTSNNPKVHELLLEYTDLVEKFQWCNDFSKARNVGLTRAKGQWFMYIDDDEWFLDSSILIEFFKSGEYKKYGSAHYKVRSYTDKTFSDYSEGWVKRLVKIEKDTLFHSKVHEHILPIRGESKALNTVVGHSGYIYETYEDNLKHFERNTSLLMKMEEEEPQNLRWKIQYIQELRSIHAWEQLEEYCKKNIDLMHEEQWAVQMIEMTQIYVGYMLALNQRGKNEETIAFYNECKHLLKNFILHKAYANLLVGEAYYRLERYDTLYEQMQEYISGYELYKMYPKKFENQELGSVFTNAYTEQMYHVGSTFLLLAELKTKRYEKIDSRISYILWETNNLKLLLTVSIELFNAYVELGEFDKLEYLFEKILSKKNTKKIMTMAIIEWKDRNMDVFRKIVRIIKKVDLWEWYRVYVESLKSGNLNHEDIIMMAKDVVVETDNVFQIPDSIHKAFSNCGVELESLYTELDFVTWKTQLAEHFACMNMTQLEELKERLSASSLNLDVRYTYFMMLYAEQKIRKVIEQLDNGILKPDIDYNELLGMFSYYTCITYEALYGAQIQNMEPEQLPGNYQAALWLQIFFEEAEKDLKKALPCLDKVVEVYPFIKEFVKTYKKSYI